MIEIRQAEKEDIGHIQRMLEALAATLGKSEEYKGTVASLAAYGFGDTPAFEALIAWQRGEPVGLVVYFYEFSTWRGRPGVYVQDLYVADAARGTGLGRRLMAVAFSRGAERGASYMRLSVHDSNRDGLAFYQKLRFCDVVDDTVMVLEGAALTALTRGQGG